MNTSEHQSHPAIRGILDLHPSLTPKAQILGNFILQNPRKAVFMTTKELANTCDVSEATVVRFVSQLGYEGYGAFQQALRDFVDRELTLLERTDISGVTRVENEWLPIGHQFAAIAVEKPDAHSALDDHGHVIPRMRVRWLGAAGLPLFKHDLDTVRIGRIAGPDGKALGRIGDGYVVAPHGTGCRGDCTVICHDVS